jgi:hypothetical protein
MRVVLDGQLDRFGALAGEPFKIPAAPHQAKS